MKQRRSFTELTLKLLLLLQHLVRPTSAVSGK